MRELSVGQSTPDGQGTSDVISQVSFPWSADCILATTAKDAAGLSWKSRHYWLVLSLSAGTTHLLLNSCFWASWLPICAAAWGNLGGCLLAAVSGHMAHLLKYKHTMLLQDLHLNQTFHLRVLYMQVAILSCFVTSSLCCKNTDFTV